MKGELQALGEEYDNIDSISKIQTQILNLSNGKVNIFDNSGNFRSTYDILKDISKIYDNLSDPDKADLTEILFGKMRGNQGIAIIQAFQSGQIEKAYEAAKNSAGSAQEEFDRWSQSIEAHINTFKASFESLSQTIIDSDLIKFIIDGGTSILNLLESIVDTVGTLGTIGLGAGIFAVVKNVGNIKTWLTGLNEVQRVVNNISNLGTAFNGGTNLFADSALVTQYANQLKGLTLQQAELALSTKTLTNEQKQQILAEAGLIASENKIQAELLQTKLAQTGLSAEKQKAILIQLGLMDAKTSELITQKACTKAALEEQLVLHGVTGVQAENIISTLGLSGANSTATISFDLLTASIWANIKALGKWLLTNPVGWAILAGTAIFGVVKAYDALTTSVEEAKENVEELMKKYDSTMSQAKSNSEKVESLASRYEELSKGVNNLGENVSLTSDQYKEYNDIVNQIAEMFPTMISGYTDEGNAILSLKGNVEELRDAYKETQKEAYNSLITSNNDIIKNYKYQVNGKESKISKTSSYIDGYGGAKDAIEIITALTGTLTPDEFKTTYNQLYEEYKNIWNSKKIRDALKSSGFDGLDWSEMTAEDLANVKSSAQATIQKYQAEIDSQLQNVRTLANAYLMTNSNYEKLDEQSKTVASLLVNSFDESIANGFKKQSDVGAYVAETINLISNDEKVKTALSNLFTLNTSDISPENISNVQKSVNEYIGIISESFNEDSEKIKERLGFTFIDDLASAYDSAISQFGTYNKEKLRDFFKENSINTVEEIDNWREITSGATSAWEAIRMFVVESDTASSSVSALNDEFSKMLDGSFKDTSDNVGKIKEALQSLAEGNYINHDDAWDIFELDTDNILNNISLINGEYELSAKELIKLKDSLINKQKEQLEADNAEAQSAIEVANIRLTAAQEELKIKEEQHLLDVGSDPMLDQYRQNISDIEEEISGYERLISKNKFLIKELNYNLGNTVTLTDVIKNNIEKMNDEVSQLKEQADNLLKAQENKIDGIINNLNDEKDVLESQKDAMEEQLDVLEKQQQEIEDIIKNYESVADIVGNAIQDEIDSIEDSKQGIEDYYDNIINKIKSANEERQDSIDLANKLAALENAKNNKVKTYKQGAGWVYSVDKEAINNAREDLLSAKRESEISSIEKEKELAVKSYDDQIEALKAYAEQWTNISKELTDAENNSLAEQILGVEWREKIKSQDTDILNKYRNNYISYKSQLDNLVNGEMASLKKSIEIKQSEINEKEKQIDVWNKYKETLQNSVKEIENSMNSYSESMNNITLNEQSSYEERITNLKDFYDNYTEYMDKIAEKNTEIAIGETKIKVIELAKDVREKMRSFFTGDVFDNGGVNTQTGFAWMDGTPSSSEVTFNASDGKKLYDLIHNTSNLSSLLGDKIAENLKLDGKNNYQPSNSASTNITNNEWKFGDIISNSPEDFMRQMNNYLRNVSGISKVNN